MQPELTTHLDPRTENLLDKPFGRWTVKAFAGYRHGNAYWVCECSCSEHIQRAVAAQALKRKQSQSCGCLQIEITIKNKTTHGMTHTPEFTVWQQMLNRCYNANDQSYSRYGGRGITVCEPWRASFEAFLEAMGPRPSSQHSIDRFPDMNGPYSPQNCRWATKQEQARNRRTNKFLTHNGITQTLGEWATTHGLSLQTLRHRLLDDWSIEEALTTPARPLNATDIPTVFTHNGVTQSLAAWAKHAGMSYTTLYRRLFRGIPFDEALSTPPARQKRPKDSY